jgi:hypothetical protein
MRNEIGLAFLVVAPMLYATEQRPLKNRRTLRETKTI